MSLGPKRKSAPAAIAKIEREATVGNTLAEVCLDRVLFGEVVNCNYPPKSVLYYEVTPNRCLSANNKLMISGSKCHAPDNVAHPEDEPKLR